MIKNLSEKEEFALLEFMTTGEEIHAIPHH